MDPFFNRFFQPSRSPSPYDHYPSRRDDDWFSQPSPSPNYYDHFTPRKDDERFFRPSQRPNYSDQFPPRKDEERFVRPSQRPNYADPSPPRKTASSSSPNVVHVPVHFVQSDKTQTEKKKLSVASAALTIQRVFRGHVVRKSLNKIASIKREVDEIERLVSLEENIKLIKRDGKEKLRVTETLMSLLLKLDSVRGVDFGVRELRKTVIKKAIRLQEFLDDVVSGTIPTEATLPTNSDEPTEEICQANNEKSSSETSTESTWSYSSEEDQGKISPADNGEKEAVNETELIQPTDSAEEPSQREVNQSENSAGEPAEEEKETSPPNVENQSTAADLAETMADWEEVSRPPPSAEERKRKEGNKDLSLLLEENEKMRGLISELVEKNEIQTQLLLSLTNRVDQLERAFVCDMLRRKKKKKCDSNAVVGLTKE